MGSWGEFIVDVMKDGRRNRHLSTVFEGYDAAASISLGVLTDALDRIEAKVDAGKSLSMEEKTMRTELHVIKSKIERKLAEYWKATYEG